MDLTGKEYPLLEDVLPFVYSEDRECMQEQQRLLMEGQGYISEFRFLLEGEITYVQAAAEIVFDDQGKPDRAVGFVLDITEQKRQQQARAKSEEQYRTLFHDACYAIWVMHPDGSFVECNHKAMEVYKADNEEQLFAHTFASLAPIEQADGTRSQEKTKQLIQKTLASGHCEFEWIAKDLENKTFWTHVSLTKLNMDGQELLQVILREIVQEKKSQADLIDSEAKYKSLFENAHYAAWLLNKEGVFIDCNSKAVELFRAKDKDELRNLSPADISPVYQPDGKNSSEQVELLRQQIIETDQCEKLEFDWRQKRLDNTEFWSHICVNKILIGGEKYILALVQDIDEEKRSQLLLQESEVKYKALFENNSVAVAILSMDGVFLEGNSKMAESLRLENKEDLVDMTPLDVSPVYQPDGKKSSERVQEYLKIIEKEGAFDFLWMNRRFDGTGYWVHIFLSKMTIGEKDVIQVVVQDIDEEKRTQQLLQESEERYKLFFENTFFAVCVLAIKGGFVAWNSQFNKLFKVDNDEEIYGKRPLIFLLNISPTVGRL